jgi:dihydrofolate reductase
MTKLVFDVSVSVDGFLAGPDATLTEPLGAGGEALHEWAFATKSFRDAHGLEGGEEGADSDVVAEHVRSIGATVMGRRMFSGGAGPWEDDPNATGWWGEEPPFHHPVFVLTHHPRADLVLQGGTTFTFVTDGIEAALERAREAAGERDVAVAGGANVIQQYLNAGLVDEFQLHVAPVLLGAGVRLFGDGPREPLRVVRSRVIASPGVAHLRYRSVPSTAS